MGSPTADLLADALATRAVRDAEGRVLQVKRLTALDRLRLFKAVGPALAQNASYLGMAALAASVVDIDGVPVPAPVSEAQVEALVGRLGENGIAAAADAWADARRETETHAGN
jgi:hypothetical protein